MQIPEPTSEGGLSRAGGLESKGPAEMGGGRCGEPGGSPGNWQPSNVLAGCSKAQGAWLPPPLRRLEGQILPNPKGRGSKVGELGRQEDSERSGRSDMGPILHCGSQSSSSAPLRSLQPPTSRCSTPRRGLPAATPQGLQPGSGAQGQPGVVHRICSFLDLPLLWKSRWLPLGPHVTSEAHAPWRCVGGPQGRRGPGVSAEAVPISDSLGVWRARTKAAP